VLRLAHEEDGVRAISSTAKLGFIARADISTPVGRFVTSSVGPDIRGHIREIRDGGDG
jgi:hypothetical protein